MAKKTAKRYTEEKKKEILDFIEAPGRGGRTKAIKKYKVTAATIGAWRRKSDCGDKGNGGKIGGGSAKELKNLKELSSLLTEIATTESKLEGLRKKYKRLKAKL